jgi:tellurite resistance protein TehA-like permease
MGFMLAGFGLLNLFIAIVLFQKVRISLQKSTSTGFTCTTFGTRSSCSV